MIQVQAGPGEIFLGPNATLIHDHRCNRNNRGVQVIFAILKLYKHLHNFPKNKSYYQKNFILHNNFWKEILTIMCKVMKKWLKYVFWMLKFVHQRCKHKDLFAQLTFREPHLSTIRTACMMATTNIPWHAICRKRYDHDIISNKRQGDESCWKWWIKQRAEVSPKRVLNVVYLGLTPLKTYWKVKMEEHLSRAGMYLFNTSLCLILLDSWWEVL